MSSGISHLRRDDADAVAVKTRSGQTGQPLAGGYDQNLMCAVILDLTDAGCINQLDRGDIEQILEFIQMAGDLSGCQFGFDE